MILAAGAGTRLRPLTDTIPKPMLPIAGEPLLAHTLRWLQAAGIREIALNLHHLPQVIRQGLGDGAHWGVRLRYSEEAELRGTAGALLPLRDFFDQSFVVVYGDLLLNLDLTTLIDTHRARGSMLTIALKTTQQPQSQGMVEFDASGRVVRFVEKPRVWPADHPWANAGVYVVEPDVLRFIPADRPSDWGFDIIPGLIAANAPVYACLPPGQVVDIGTLAVYEQIKDRGL
ncbi:nucleotidyltransferase family protein [Kallotenue papyrolyticum]|uniref:nucleotidyltransferase family protein n=1 Tax=Kallotenue papyrolyticum TaxID=1325125 RepID=UPI0023EB2968|nr:nucleotidyltransferase family protein [Kallotenue papyrolyticum]